MLPRRETNSSPWETWLSWNPFSGAEPFIKPLMQMTSLEQIMGTVLPYISVTVKEKQELLEILSLREKSLKFIDLLLKQKESINMQLEMAKNNSNYRRMMLQEQLKSIQEELRETGETDSENSIDKEYNNLSFGACQSQSISKKEMSGGLNLLRLLLNI